MQMCLHPAGIHGTVGHASKLISHSRSGADRDRDFIRVNLHTATCKEPARLMLSLTACWEFKVKKKKKRFGGSLEEKTRKQGAEDGKGRIQEKYSQKVKIYMSER